MADLADLRRHHLSLHKQMDEAKQAREQLTAILSLPHIPPWVDLAGEVERKLAAITRDRLVAALQHPAVTGALAMLGSQGGTPADVADAIVEALDD